MLGLVSSLTTGSAHEQMYSLTVDGTGDWLDTGDAFQSTHRVNFSYSLWVKPDEGQRSGGELFLGTINSSAEDYFFIQLVPDGKIKIWHQANDDNATYLTDAVVYASGAGDWKHVCVTVTKNTSGNTSYIIYIDGAVVAGGLTNAISDTNHALWTSTDNLFIGAVDPATKITGNILAGKIDEVTLWNVALDADAVAAVYNSGKPFNLNYDRGNYDNSSALQGYWRMNDGSGTTVVDSSGNGNNGTLAADATFSTDTPDD